MLRGTSPPRGTQCRAKKRAARFGPVVDEPHLHFSFLTRSTEPGPFKSSTKSPSRKLRAAGALGPMLSTSVPTSETFNEALHPPHDMVERTPAVPEPDVQATRVSRIGTSLKSQGSPTPAFPQDVAHFCSGRTGRGSCSWCLTRPGPPTLTSQKYVNGEYVDVEDMNHSNTQRAPDRGPNQKLAGGIT